MKLNSPTSIPVSVLRRLGDSSPTNQTTQWELKLHRRERICFSFHYQLILFLLSFELGTWEFVNEARFSNRIQRLPHFQLCGYWMERWNTLYPVKLPLLQNAVLSSVCSDFMSCMPLGKIPPSVTKHISPMSCLKQYSGFYLLCCWEVDENIKLLSSILQKLTNVVKTWFFTLYSWGVKVILVRGPHAAQRDLRRAGPKHL